MLTGFYWFSYSLSLLVPLENLARYPQTPPQNWTVWGFEKALALTTDVLKKQTKKQKS